MSSPLEVTRAQITESQSHYDRAATIAADTRQGLDLEPYAELHRGSAEVQDFVTTIYTKIQEVLALAELAGNRLTQLELLGLQTRTRVRTGLMPGVHAVGTNIREARALAAEALDGASPDCPPVRQMLEVGEHLGGLVMSSTAPEITADQTNQKVDMLVSALMIAKRQIEAGSGAVTSATSGFTAASESLFQAVMRSFTAETLAQQTAASLSQIPEPVQAFDQAAATYLNTI